MSESDADKVMIAAVVLIDHVLTYHDRFAISGLRS